MTEGKCLEDGTHDDAYCRDREMNGYDMQGRYADPQHILRRVEEGKQGFREQVHDDSSSDHDPDSDDNR